MWVFTAAVSPPLPRLQADPAVEVVGHAGDDQHHHEGFEEPAQQEVDERQLEDVEADVPVILGVVDTEAGVVAEQIPVVPFPVGAGPGEQGEHGTHGDPHDAARGNTDSR